MNVSSSNLEDAGLFVVHIEDAQVTIGCYALVRFNGRLASTGAAELEAVARRVHRAAMGFRPQRIVVDVRALEWASEAVVRVFVAWAMWIEHGSAPKAMSSPSSSTQQAPGNAPPFAPSRFLRLLS